MISASWRKLLGKTIQSNLVFVTGLSKELTVGMIANKHGREGVNQVSFVPSNDASTNSAVFTYHSAELAAKAITKFDR